MPKLFTSESVSEGHPDKLADSLSDSILDALLAQDPESRVAIEVLATNGLIQVAGEVRTEAYVNISDIVRKRIIEAGYDSSVKSFDGHTCGVNVAISEQSPDIANGVDNSFEGREGTLNDKYDALGAGDQGLVFGGAVNENPDFLPTPIHLSHKIIKRLEEVRKNSFKVPGIGLDGSSLYPDAKSQVTIEYNEDGQPIGIDTIVLSTQHAEHASLEWVREFVKASVIDPVLAEYNENQKEYGYRELDLSGIRYFINPTGRFVIGGPKGDAGLTGRKIIVDTYGGYFRHGGGAFCFATGTKVKTANGSKNIENITKGELIWTKNEQTGFAVLKPVNHLIKNTKENSEQLLEIELESGEIIKVTENHEIYTQRGWVPAGQLNLDDEIEEFANLKVRKSQLQIENWLINENLTLEESKNKVSIIQKANSPLTAEYWKKRGYSKEESLELISQNQRKRSPASPDYYTNKGFSEDEASLKVSQYQGSTLQNWSKEEIDSLRADSVPTLQNLVKKFGTEEGTKRHNSIRQGKSLGRKEFVNKFTEEERIEYFGRQGSSNGMYQITPGHEAGSGISGYYEDKLFRSLLELSGFLKAEKENFNYLSNEIKGSNTPKVEILYRDSEGNDCRYVPDILILNNEGTVQHIIEIKPDEYQKEFQDTFSSKPEFIRAIKNQGLSFDIWVYKRDIFYEKNIYQKLYSEKTIEIHPKKLGRFLKFINAVQENQNED